MQIESREFSDCFVLTCRGRVVFRHEAAALSRAVSDLLEQKKSVILDVSEVDTIDSAGLGELVLLHMWSEGNGCPIRIAGPNARIRNLLQITNLVSVFRLYASVEEARNPGRALGRTA
ncbi:MAG TPA: STAS domain-containing protein [Terriglobales bacterium]|nr:STAS domain-containing protein [Terriglobales bacterium]